MKAPNILNDIFNEINTALIMKNVMKAANVPNEIFNERIQH